MIKKYAHYIYNLNSWPFLLGGIDYDREDTIPNIIKARYFDFKFLAINEEERPALDELAFQWTKFIQSNEANYLRLFDAFEEMYKATENYDRREEGSIIDELHKGSKSTTTPDLEVSSIFEPDTNINTTTTPGITTTTTETPGVKSKESTYKNAFDSSTPVLDGYIENEIVSGTNTTSVKASGTDLNNVHHTGQDITSEYTTGTTTTSIEDISETKFDHNVHTFENYRIHGNIGVKSGSQLLLEELEARKVNLIEMIVKEFINKYCFIDLND